MKRKVLSYSLWAVACILLFVVMAFVQKSRIEQTMNEPSISIDSKKGMVFLTKPDVLQRLSLNGVYKENMAFDDLNLDSVENFLLSMNEVDNVDVYAKLGGEWDIQLYLKRPIARIINSDGSQFYLDDKGRLMHLSNLFTANVVPITGDFSFWKEIDLDTLNKEIHNDTLITIGKLDQIYTLSRYVCNDAFLSAQITQIHLEDSGDFILIPRVGNQTINLGKATNLEEKFEKLKIFYKEGINKVGWEKYKTINLKFAGQVVCTKY